MGCEEEATMGLREVSTILWRERHLLELLLFKLEEEQLLLAAGRNRWLARATREVEMVLEEIKHTELERALEVERVAPELGLPAHASLRQLAEAAPPPWQEILTDHRQMFLSLTEDVSGLVQANRELLARGQRAVREVMASIGEGRSEAGTGYGPGRDLGGVKPLLIDQAL
jgi:hypothetical protein